MTKKVFPWNENIYVEHMKELWEVVRLTEGKTDFKDDDKLIFVELRCVRDPEKTLWTQLNTAKIVDLSETMMKALYKDIE